MLRPLGEIQPRIGYGAVCGALDLVGLLVLGLFVGYNFDKRLDILLDGWNIYPGGTGFAWLYVLNGEILLPYSCLEKPLARLVFHLWQIPDLVRWSRISSTLSWVLPFMTLAAMALYLDNTSTNVIAWASL